MSKEMFISSSPHETKVAVLDDDALVEVYFERDTDVGLVGGIYKGRVSRVLPGMQSAFVDIGLERDAFLYVSDFFEDAEEYDKIVTETEGRVARLTQRAARAPEKIPEAPPVASAPEPAPAPVEAEPSPEPAPAAAPEPAPPASTEKSSAAGSESHGRDHHGRRRRRRGGRFRDRFSKPAPRERAEKKPEAPEHDSHSFEVLPGESLAKYSHPGPEPSAPEPSAAEETPSTATEIAAPEPPSDFTPAAAEESLSPEPIATEASSEFTPPAAEEPIPSEPAITAPAEAAEPPVVQVEPEPVAEVSEPEAAAAPQAAEPVVAAEPEPEAGEGERPRPLWNRIVSSVFGETPAPASEDAPAEPQASSDMTSEAVTVRAQITADSQQASAEAEPESGAAEATPAEEASESQEASGTPENAEPAPGEPAEREYTLREPHQRPRFAPRRGRRGRRGRGRRDFAPRGGVAKGSEGARAGNFQAPQISELLKEGQEILVQIAKEPLGRKGARITSHIALPGRYLVYMPTVDHTGVSRKISSEEERLRLRNLIQENKGSLSGGFIVRTAASGQSEEELKADMDFLFRLWADIRSKAEATKAPALLHADLDLVQRMLRDILTPDFKSIWVDNEIEYERSVDFVNRCQPSLVGKVKLYTRPTSLFEEFNIQTEIEKALKPKVWLKSGGYIVINQTEALVAIDVNTGKYVGKTNRLEDTIVKTNIDAVNEIVRQVRLRDLGGIIVIDFIDMDERRNRNKVVQALEEALRRDRAPTKILSFNDFGLVAVTRKRVKHSLERTLCEPCSYCSGSGWVKSVATVCHEILAEARKMAGELEGDVATLRVNPEVRRALKSQEGVVLSELEAVLGKNVIVKSDPSVHQERFEIY